jgi:hypothetical protein
MKTQTIFAKNKCIFCRFEGECEFKKTFTKKNMSEPKTRYAICTWKGRCNQQIDHPKQTIQNKDKNQKHPLTGLTENVFPSNRRP